MIENTKFPLRNNFVLDQESNKMAIAIDSAGFVLPKEAGLDIQKTKFMRNLVSCRTGAIFGGHLCSNCDILCIVNLITHCLYQLEEQIDIQAKFKRMEESFKNLPAILPLDKQRLHRENVGNFSQYYCEYLLDSFHHKLKFFELNEFERKIEVGILKADGNLTSYRRLISSFSPKHLIQFTAKCDFQMKLLSCKASKLLGYACPLCRLQTLDFLSFNQSIKINEMKKSHKIPDIIDSLLSRVRHSITHYSLPPPYSQL